MRPGGRLRLALAALLLAAVAAPVLLFARATGAISTATGPAEPSATDRALARLAASGPGRGAPAPAAPGPTREQLARGYPDDEAADPGGLTGAALLCALSLLAALALALAAAAGRRLDDDLLAIAVALEAAPEGGGPALPPPGLGLRESELLAAAVARLLPPPDEPSVSASAEAPERRRRFQLLASMSHDLRSPLNSILGFAELLRRGEGGPLPDAAGPPLEGLRRTGRRLLGLCTQILDTARYEAGRLSLERRPTLVAGLLRDAVNELGRTVDLPPDVELQPVLQPGLAAVDVDRMRVAEALALLLGEAASRSGPGVVRLGASEQPQGDGHALVIEIEAPGALPPERASTLSAAFRNLTPGDLGLAVPLARALIELHDGTLAIDEGPPGRFVVTLRASAGRRSPHPRAP